MRLIDADALMEEFVKFVRESNNSDFAPIPTWNDAVSLTGSAPTVDAVERKRGRWILTQDDNYEYCTCSECGYQNGENWMIGSDIPFCAMCGAEMRKGEEE